MVASQFDELHVAITLRHGGTIASNPLTNGQVPASVTPKEKDSGEKAKKEKAPKVVKEKPQWGAPGSGKKETKAKAKETEPEEPIQVTPEGDKKNMDLPMAATYKPKAVESAWSAWWEKQGYFTPDPKAAKGTAESKRFVMVMPPPNVTGSLHLGHTLTGAIEDSLTRWHRMCGDMTLWLPGIDHAGIATQSIVERLIYKNEGKTRHDLGREKFLERVWDWKEKNGSAIKHQLQKIASSADTTRERFTMDPMLNKAVVEAFIRFHDQGLIYRDNRLVNWCPFLQTALSDIEVDHEEIAGITHWEIPGYSGKVEVGVMCEFKYKVKGTSDFLIVATTRLETMLGDTAVAVHPKDERYSKFVGKEIEHPFFPDRKMIVVADDMVDPEFGTGCVKITPAHDFNDFKCGQRHKLKMISIFAEDGNVNMEGGQFKGQHRFEARGKVEEELKKLGVWVGKKPHAMKLGRCSRSKDIIEPYMKPQWWMNCKELASKSVDAVRNGSLKMVPEFHHHTWYQWLENIQEWCISRQLWWGHRIPAYKVVKPEQKEEIWVTGKTEEEARQKAIEKLGVKDVEVRQDDDVLDTWFSSGLFPFSTMGWPDTEGNDDFDAFFPNSLLETGHDILFFWVARMVMMSIGLTGKLPFHTVYLHAMVRDAHGRKMSKSLGNVIDPIEVIDGITLNELNQKLLQGNLPEKEIEKATKCQAEDYPEGIPECGADALRFGLLAYTLQGRNVNLDINRVVGYRHFCNKVWNASRFGLRYFGDDYSYPGSLPLKAPFAWEDRWILSRLSACAGKANKAFKDYEFANATTATYSFFQYELCDVYLELLKPRFYDDESTPENKDDRQVARDVLYVCLDWSMRLMHPLLPYLTEELYQRLPKSPTKCESVVVAPYPTHVIGWVNDTVEQEMELISGVAKQFRSHKTSMGLKPGARPAGFVSHTDEESAKSLKKLAIQLSRMSGMGNIDVLKAGAPPPKGAIQDVVNDKCLIFTETAGVDLAQEVTKLEKKMASADKMAKSYEIKMAVPGYLENVPADVREQNAQKHAASLREVEEMKRALDGIKSAMT